MFEDRVENGQAGTSPTDQQRQVSIKFHHATRDSPMIRGVDTPGLNFQGCRGAARHGGKHFTQRLQPCPWEIVRRSARQHSGAICASSACAICACRV